MGPGLAFYADRLVLIIHQDNIFLAFVLAKGALSPQIGHFRNMRVEMQDRVAPD